MGAVEPDSVKSARKARDKLHKACERASETRERLCMGRNKTMRTVASMRESRDSDQFSSQHTSTITCTAAPKVWHFSAFHLLAGLSSVQLTLTLHTDTNYNFVNK